MPQQQRSEGCVERRVIRGGQVRAKGGDKPGLAGVASVYNQDYDNGWFIEHVMPGAFTRVLSEDPDVRCLFNHNPDNLLARTKSGTLRLADSPDGLTYDADTNPETTVGRDVQAMVDRGDLDGCSIGFCVAKQNWREEKQEDGTVITHRDIVEFDELFDVGPVTYPAFTGTSVGTRSLWPQGVPAEIRSHVPGLRGTVVELVASAEVRDASECDCPCAACQDGNCAGCNCDGCDSEECSNEECRCGDDERKLRMSMRLRLAEHA
jgi:HK97 family phage prohead protease